MTRKELTPARVLSESSKRESSNLATLEPNARHLTFEFVETFRNLSKHFETFRNILKNFEKLSCSLTASSRSGGQPGQASIREFRSVWRIDG